MSSKYLSGDISFFILRINTFVNIITIVPTHASNISFNPVKTPIAATAQIVAAVFKPFILLSLIAMAPAPRKPIPDITCAGILIISSSDELKLADIYKKAPKQTIMFVLNPA